ncbi:chaplin [Streptomyces sasae]|uniref:chaplin n=1 Tax=Streptomyces sasae TaxID=1266772 RepID=UPI00292DD6B9|nr:chaplin [Streptomyces sasae]
MRIRVLAATGALATALVLTGSATAFAGDDGGASAHAAAIGSPGLLSGNVVQIPIDIPINVCGNTFGAANLLSPTVGNICVNK